MLEELLVVDVSNGVAGAYCCLLFRYLGAEVVRIDRSFRPHSDDDGLAAYLNAGKKSITLDASRPEGAELLLHLAERADVLVTDQALSPNLDYATLSRQNPRLILTRIVEPSNGEGLFSAYFTGLNSFAATLLPLVNMAILGRGQEVEVDDAECVAAAAFAVDGEGRWPQVEDDKAFPPPPFWVAGQTEGLPPATARPGEHNDEIYGGVLGLSGEEMARLKEKAII